jgi:hypothetical protein
VSISGGPPFEESRVTITGTNERLSISSTLVSNQGQGPLTVIAPLRIDTAGIAGRAALRFEFKIVPEPGSLLLLVSGALCLAVIGRGRTRRSVPRSRSV